MKKLLLVSVFAAFFVAFVSACFGQMTIPDGASRKEKGILLESSKGMPKYWTLVGYTNGIEGKVAVLSDGSSELRRMDPADFLVLPPIGKRFKLAQIDGKGKFLPVDLVNAAGKEKGEFYLAWVIVTE